MNVKFAAIVFVSLTLTTAADAWSQGYHDHHEAYGERFGAAPQSQRPAKRHPAATDDMARLLHWNEVALDANALDHTPVSPGESRVFGEQLGPARTSRALAIAHIAVFDAINAITGEYRTYTGIAPASHGASIGAAVAQAMHDALCGLFPSQAIQFDAMLQEDMKHVPSGPPKTRGLDTGRRAAAAILALRANDGSQHAEDRIGIEFIPSNAPGKWRQDPVSLIPLAYGAHWGGVKPFVIDSAAQFRAPPPPALTSAEYTEAYNEVKRLGGDGVVTPTQRTPAQTLAALYWAYDGTAGIGTPPRLYNQIAVQIAQQKRVTLTELARLLALLNVAIADAGIASWETKYVYQFWRPVTAIRESDPGTGPTGAGDGNAATTGDPDFMPLGAPASNLMGPNFTPPFPAYVSGHATFGGAVFQTLRNFFRTDDIAFTFVSDELNGMTLDNTQNVRPLVPRTFASLSQAEEENGQSRIYLGIHWAFDKTRGIAQGRSVADYVFANAFEPLRGRDAER